MKKKIFVITAAVLAACILFGFAACSSGSGFWKASGIDTDLVEKVEIVNRGGAIKVVEGERLDSFMDELGKLSVSKDKNAYPDNDYDYYLKIYIKYVDGYVRYYLGQELTKVNMKSGIKEGFYIFADYDAAMQLVADYFYAE